jgi:hypothetical protein
MMLRSRLADAHYLYLSHTADVRREMTEEDDRRLRPSSLLMDVLGI